MNRGTRTLVVVAIAIAVATLATMAVYRAVQQIPVREVERPGVPIVVAARNLPIGTALGQTDMRVAIWPATNPVPGGFASPEPLINRGIVSEMVENEPITAAKLSPVEAGAGLSPIIPEGMRAISVQVNDVVGVAGFVTPGNHVDVVATISKNELNMSRIVVPNVKVLAAGTRLDQQQAKGGEPIKTNVVTLLVTPAEAERIALASTEGRLHLTLRNPLDTAVVETTGVRITNLLGSVEAPKPPPRPARTVARAEPPPPPPPPPPPKPYTVETIRAAKRVEEVVK